jgi:hypothetical protein
MEGFLTRLFDSTPPARPAQERLIYEAGAYKGRLLYWRGLGWTHSLSQRGENAHPTAAAAELDFWRCKATLPAHVRRAIFGEN